MSRTLSFAPRADVLRKLRADVRSSVMALGIASGLSEQWLGHVFRFAPVPHVCYRIKERRKGSGWSTRTGEGFLELCDGLLAGGVAAWQPLAARQAAIEFLRELEEKGLVKPLDDLCFAFHDVLRSVAS